MAYSDSDLPIALMKTSRTAETSRDPRWEHKTATTPTRWLMWGHNKVMLTPKRAAGYAPNYDTIKFGYIEMPSLLTTPGDVVDSRIPPKDQEYLKYAAAYYLLNMRTDKQFTDMAEYFMQTFHKLIGA